MFQKLLGIDVLWQRENVCMPTTMCLGPVPLEDNCPNSRELEEGRTEGWEARVPVAVVLCFVPGMLCLVLALGCAIMLMDRLKGFVRWWGKVVWQWVFWLPPPHPRPGDGGESFCLLNALQPCDWGNEHR